MLKIIHPVCCGIDVHKKFVFATIATTGKNNVTTYQSKSFSTFNFALENLATWLIENKCTEVCMESTGKYWIPVFNILEKNDIRVTLANPKYVKPLKGKKTDKKDSIWIADLFKHGLVPGSYIPPKSIRMLRDICRYRTKLVSNRSGEKNRIQNSLTMSNIAIPSVLTDTFGKTAQAIIEYLLTCEQFDPEYCKTLIDPRVKASPDEIINAILGYDLSFEQANKLRIAKLHLLGIEQCIFSIDASVDKLAQPYEQQIRIIASLPGHTKVSAIRIISEIGVDMSVFYSAKHLCSWGGLTPQNNESAGKKKSTRIGRAGVYLKPLLVQCANAAVKDKKNPYFREKFMSLKKRMTHKKAIIAISRMMLTCIFHMLSKDEMFAPSDLARTENAEQFLLKKKQKQLQAAIAFVQKNGFDVSEKIPNQSL